MAWLVASWVNSPEITWPVLWPGVCRCTGLTNLASLIVTWPKLLAASTIASPPMPFGLNKIGTYSMITRESWFLWMDIPPICARNDPIAPSCHIQLAACTVFNCSTTPLFHSFWAPTKVMPSGTSSAHIPIKDSVMFALDTTSFSVRFSSRG